MSWVLGPDYHSHWSMHQAIVRIRRAGSVCLWLIEYYTSKYWEVVMRWPYITENVSSQQFTLLKLLASSSVVWYSFMFSVDELQSIQQVDWSHSRLRNDSFHLCLFGIKIEWLGFAFTVLLILLGFLRRACRQTKVTAKSSGRVVPRRRSRLRHGLWLTGGCGWRCRLNILIVLKRVSLRLA